MRSSSAAGVFLIPVWLTIALPSHAGEGTARETAGWHLLRPGESLASIARLYLGSGEAQDQVADRNPEFETLGPGDRVQVQLRGGLPGKTALLSVAGGRVDGQPTPVSWLRFRRFDLLREGDGLRTFPSSSAELTFADSTRLLVTEESLVFLRDGGVRQANEHPDEIEILHGQADLKHGVIRRQEEQAIEIVMGTARARPRSDRQGEVEARVRHTPDGDAQLMVYRGTSELEAAGTTVQVTEGTGSVIPANGPPSPPQPLLPAPALLAPLPGAASEPDGLHFAWSAVAGADSYTFELCRDPDCGQLVEREAGLRRTEHRIEGRVAAPDRKSPVGAPDRKSPVGAPDRKSPVGAPDRARRPPIAAGTYFWRVTAAAASELDGFPSASAALSVIEPALIADLPVPRSAIVGAVRSAPYDLPMPGVTVAVVELGKRVRSGADGRFELPDLPVGAYTLEARLQGLVVGRAENVVVAPEHPAEVVLVSDAAAFVAHEEIEVRPSRVTLLEQDPIAPLALGRDEILALPHLGDDILRALPLLPGTTANDVSAQFHVRGGRRDEVQIVLDGQELYDAFHLPDFDNALSVVAPAALGSVDLSTGGWSAEQGDRMGGVLDMTTLTPEGRRTQLGVSLMTLQAGSAGTFQDQRGSWLGTARRGTLDLAGRLFGQEDPSYWDALGKASYRFGDRQTASVHALSGSDVLDFEELVDGEVKERRTRHDSLYFWLTHQALLDAAGTQMFVDSFTSWSRIDGERRALDLEEDQHFRVQDGRGFDVFELRQDWSLQATPQHLLGWGGGLRRYDALYDYASDKRYSTLVAQIRTDPGGSFRFRDALSGEHYAGHLTDRWRPLESLVLELGLRYDRQSWLHEEQVSPRINLAYSLSETGVLRASWGRFAQSQRPYEIEVQDGETTLHPAERSEHWLLGYERVLTGPRLAGAAIRVEAYRRRIANPRPRFENLFEPYNSFPELEPDRVRIAPERSLGRGVELFLRGPAQSRVGWWVNYSLASIEDRLDDRWIRRKIDQTHTLNASLSLPLPKRWVVNLAWRFHSGWPTTLLGLVEVPGEPGEERELEVVLGPINSERLTSYHRLDLRASRELPVRRGRMLFFIDVQNLYNHRNLAGFDIQIDEEEGTLDAVEEYWPGFFPSVGVSYEF